jgi:hypothetical protein
MATTSAAGTPPKPAHVTGMGQDRQLVDASQKVMFASDSPVEGDGFEPSVPPYRETPFVEAP